MATTTGTVELLSFYRWIYKNNHNLYGIGKYRVETYPPTWWLWAYLIDQHKLLTRLRILILVTSREQELGQEVGLKFCLSIPPDSKVQASCCTQVKHEMVGRSSSRCSFCSLIPGQVAVVDTGLIFHVFCEILFQVV
jgi:hypothetical protein